MIPARFLYFALIVILGSCSSPVTAQEISVQEEALDTAISKETFKEVTSVLVSHQGSLISEQYWGVGGVDYLNDTRSATKSLTAMTVGAAIMDGHLSGISDTMVRWFEAERPFRFESDAKDAITLKDLLTMSSALDCNDNVWETPGNEEHMYPARSWTYFVVDMPTDNTYARDSSGQGLFRYCTAGSFILGQIVERATNQPVDEYISERLLAPLGISQVNWDRSPSGEVMTGGGAEFRSRDLMKLGELVRQGGTLDGKTILGEDWSKDMLTAHVNANDKQDYGYQWWRRDFDCGAGSVSGWYMAGNGGNKVAIFEELDLTVVVTAQLYGTSGMHQQSTDIIEDYVLSGHTHCKIHG